MSVHHLPLLLSR